ncbi:MFS transporter [Luteipulveratus mongoliensis]|uniref:MFS transporter n=2 Tax=Luteipulveratus mongoliensis TaxID=571913 RepID=A0A0K1JFI3_9MICO|nr:MFS transporter [Luteipulveratus mongoliensis]
MTAPTLSATAEPTTPVGRGWMWRFNLAWVGIMIGLFGPIQILLPNQAENIDPANKEFILALVTALGALCSTVANPLWGALSDRTTSRFGRRMPWIVVGAVVGAMALVGVGATSSVLLMALGWCVVQTALNAPWAALTAVVPDQVPAPQRGSAAGWLGLAQMLGAFIAIGVATVLPGVAGYAACAVVMLLVLVPFVRRRQDSVLPKSQQPSWSWGGFVRGFWINPRDYPDFGWAWLTRFLFNLSNAAALVYLLYFLRDELNRDNAETGVLILGAVNAVGVVLAVVVSGVWSDRLGRRKVFVTASGVIMAAAGVMLAVSPTWAMAIPTAFVLGIGFGVYTSVDFALITEVLPAAAARGKDMGVLNIASSLPQVLAPAIAAVVVTHVGGYPMLFLISGIVSAVGAVLVRFIKSVD